MEPMEDEGGWPAPKKDTYLYTRPKGNGSVNYDNNAKEIKMFEIVHEEMQYGLKSYKSNGLRKVISAITYRCGGDTELLALRLTDPELEARWLKVRWLRARWNNKDNQHWR